MTRNAEIQLRANGRGLNQDLERMRKDMRSKMGRLGRDLASSVGGALRGSLDLVGLGGIGAIAAAGRQVYQFQTALTRLQISSGKTKNEMQLLERQLFRVGKSTGTDPDELLAGAAAFTALTGDLGTYTKGLEDLAKVSTATGASMDDLSKVAAALQTNLGVGGEDFGKAFDVIAAQGKVGAVELNELARELAGLTPQFATFGTTGVEGLRDLAAMLQLTRSGFGTTAEAATGFRAIMTNLVQNAEKFKKAGINVFDTGPDGVKRMRALSDIVYDIGESPLGKNQTQLIKAFGSSEAYRAILPLMSKGRAEFEKMSKIDAQGTIGKDFATFMESNAGKIQSAGAAMKEAFNDALKGNIEGIADAMKGLAKAIAWIGNNKELAIAAFAALRFGPGVIGALTAAGGVAGVAGGAAGAAGGGTATAVGGGLAGAAGRSLAGALGLNAVAGMGATAITTSATGGLGAIAAAGTGVAATASAMVVGAGAAGYALGTLAEKTFSLGERFANLARGDGFVKGDPEEDRLVEAAAARRKARKDAIEGAEALKKAGKILLTGLELGKYGYRGENTPDAILGMAKDIDPLRKAAATAKALGLSNEQIRQLGPTELLRQFPTKEAEVFTPDLVNGMPNMFAPWTKKTETVLDKDAFAKARANGAGAPLNRAGNELLASPQRVEVIVRFDDAGRGIAEVVDNVQAQGRR